MALKISGTTVIDDNKNIIDVNPLKTYTAAASVTQGKVLALRTDGKVEEIFTPPPPAKSAKLLTTDRNSDVLGPIVRFGNTDNYLTSVASYNPNLVYFRAITINQTTGTISANGPDTTMGFYGAYNPTYSPDIQAVCSINDTTVALLMQPYNDFVQFVVVKLDVATMTCTFTRSILNGESGIPNPGTNRGAGFLFYDQATNSTIVGYGMTFVKMNVDYSTGLISTTNTYSSRTVSGFQYLTFAQYAGGIIGFGAKLNAIAQIVKIVINPSDTVYGFDFQYGAETSNIIPANFSYGIGWNSAVYSVDSSSNQLRFILDTSNLYSVNIDYSTLTPISYTEDVLSSSNTFETAFIQRYAELYPALTKGATANDSWIERIYPTADPFTFVVAAMFWTQVSGGAAEGEQACIAVIKTDSNFNVVEYGELFEINAHASYPRSSRIYGNLCVIFYETFSGAYWDGNAIVAACFPKLTNSSSAFGIAQTSASTNQSVQVAVDGSISKVHTNLKTGDKYYYTNAGEISTVSQTNSVNSVIGYAISDTRLKINKTLFDSYIRSSDLGFTVPKNSALLPTKTMDMYEVFYNTQQSGVAAISGATIESIVANAGLIKGVFDKNVDSANWNIDNSYLNNNPRSFSIKSPYVYSFNDEQNDSRIALTASSNFFVREKLRATANANYAGLIGDTFESLDRMNVVIASACVYDTKVIVFVYSGSATISVNTINVYCIDYSSGSPVSTLVNTFPTPDSNSLNANNLHPLGFLAWDPALQRLLFLQWGSNGSKYAVSYSVNSETGVLTQLKFLLLASNTHQDSIPYTSALEENALKFIPEKSCFVIATSNGEYSQDYVVRKFTVSSAGDITHQASPTMNTSWGMFGVVTHWRPDTQKLWVMTRTYNQFAHFAYWDITSSPTVSSTYTISLSNYNNKSYQINGFAYVPGIPGNAILLCNTSSGQMYLIPPSASSTDTSFVPDYSGEIMGNPFGGNINNAPCMVYDSDKKRLITCLNSSSPIVNVSSYYIERNSDPTKPPFKNNVSIRIPNIRYSASIPCKLNPVFGENTQYVRAHLVKLNSQTCQYVLLTSSKSASNITTADIFAYKFNLMPQEAIVNHSRLLGVAHPNYSYVTTGAYDTTNSKANVWFYALGNLAPGVFGQTNSFYGNQYSRGVMYYLLPDGILTTDSSAVGAIKFGKFMSQQGSILVKSGGESALFVTTVG